MKYIQYIILVGIAQMAFAQNLSTVKEIGLPGTQISSLDALIKKLQSITGMLQDITAIIAVIGVCIVGIMYITSHGDEEKTGAAKKYMIVIIIGVLIAFSAWGMISLINVIPNSITLSGNQ